MNNRTIRDMEQPISKPSIQKRTEQEILKDFEMLGWKVTLKEGKMITLRYVKNERNAIWIEKDKSYSTNTCIDMQEHKLLNELFTLWGWI